MPLQGRLSIEHLCQLVAVSRRGFYRSLRQREPAEEETEVRSLIRPEGFPGNSSRRKQPRLKSCSRLKQLVHLD